VDWKDEDVWEFLNDVAKVPHCELYDLGYKRLGCIGCPMATDAERQLDRYPKYKEAYLRAFDRMLENMEKRGLVAEAWKTADDVMSWWLGKKTAREEAEGQVSMFEEAEP
jgi:phosphoadenosine phosphosulfate reductase